MNFNKVHSDRRAVAPIIATLLMVAIAVVGGILIFVFTQGFFAEEQVVGPTFDNLEIFGYDAADSVGTLTFDDNSVECDDGVAATAENDLTEGDCVMIYVTNGRRCRARRRE